MRISKILAEKYDISVRTAKKYIKDGAASLDGRITRKDGDYVRGELTLNITFAEKCFSAESYLIADFGNIIFFDKPVNMHSERHKPDDSLTVSDVVERYKSGYNLISRLDYTTDGIIAAAKEGYEPSVIKKTYLAVVCGNFESEAYADYLIDAEKRTYVKISAEHGGNTTKFSPVRHKNGLTLVKAEFSKASRHQLRAYLAHIGFPILGDSAYGGHEFSRVMLHSAEAEIDGIKANSGLTSAFAHLFDTCKIKQ